MADTPTTEQLVTAALAEFTELCNGIAADIHALADITAAKEA